MDEIAQLREEFYKDVKVSGTAESFNQELEKALRVADFLELGELFAKDALHREESCGGHFREEHQTEDGEAKRDDENFAYVAAWEYKENPRESVLHKEDLVYENIKLVTRSYK
jgi:succinate dehydrogenase / fumarate reductase flavoprotein subunit